MYIQIEVIYKLLKQIYQIFTLIYQLVQTLKTLINMFVLQITKVHNPLLNKAQSPGSCSKAPCPGLTAVSCKGT